MNPVGRHEFFGVRWVFAKKLGYTLRQMNRLLPPSQYNGIVWWTACLPHNSIFNQTTSYVGESTWWMVKHNLFWPTKYNLLSIDTLEDVERIAERALS